MIFDYTANPFGSATGLGIGILYEFAALGASTPPTAITTETCIQAGISFGIPREITIGGFN